MKHLLLTLSMGLSVIVCADASEVPVDSRGNNQTFLSESELQGELIIYEEGELARLLAPIALYPDSLLSHILIATTYPLEVIEAYRFRDQHAELSAELIVEDAEEKDWDPSVKALLPFTQILKKLHDDLSWTQALGSAFLANEKQVMASIQSLRAKADEAGHLSSMDNAEVRYEKEKIIIAPARKEVIYVPYYDTRIVYGDWPWRYHPPIHWHFASHRYSHYYPYHWRSGVYISAGFYFSAIHWHKHYVAVDYAYRAHHRGHYRARYNQYRGKRHAIIKSGYAKQWRHNPHHRKGVTYRVHGKKVKHYAGYSKKPTVYGVNKSRALKGKSYAKHHKTAVKTRNKVHHSNQYVANGKVRKTHTASHKASKNKHQQTVNRVKSTRVKSTTRTIHANNNKVHRVKKQNYKAPSTSKYRQFNQSASTKSRGEVVRSKKAQNVQRKSVAKSSRFGANKQTVNRSQKRQFAKSSNQQSRKVSRASRGNQQGYSRKSYSNGKSERRVREK